MTKKQVIDLRCQSATVRLTIEILGNAELALDVPEKVSNGHDATPYDLIVERYHEHCPTLTRIKVLTEVRKRHIRARWREVVDGRTNEGALDWFTQFFQRVNRAHKLTGGMGNGSWSADFDWLMRPANFVRVHEGAYDG